MIGLLQRFPGYTLSSLRAEDGELLRLIEIVEMGRVDVGDDLPW